MACIIHRKVCNFSTLTYTIARQIFRMTLWDFYAFLTPLSPHLMQIVSPLAFLLCGVYDSSIWHAVQSATNFTWTCDTKINIVEKHRVTSCHSMSELNHSFCWLLILDQYYKMTHAGKHFVYYFIFTRIKLLDPFISEF